jgi:predicted protein tyrosine phosphatase
MKPWIQNISLADVKNGHHYDAGSNSMLIQIVDPGVEFPSPKYKFKQVHQFRFLDVEDPMYVNPLATEFDIKYKDAITNTDAKGIALALQQALANHMNVIVHCHAGICRSGAVAEVGVMLGFQDTESFRSPNLMVKRMLLEQLGMTYDPKEPHTINGIIVSEDWNNDNEKVFILADARRKLREQDQ